MGGYFADSNSGWSNTISNFDAKNDWTRVFLISDKIIATLYSNLNAIKIVSDNTHNPVPYAIAQIMKVAAMSRVTDAYGAIPYSKIGEDGKITTPYDSQEEVYNKFFEELDGAIAVLTENRNAALLKKKYPPSLIWSLYSENQITNHWESYAKLNYRQKKWQKVQSSRKWGL